MRPGCDGARSLRVGVLHRGRVVLGFHRARKSAGKEGTEWGVERRGDQGDYWKVLRVCTEWDWLFSSGRKMEKTVPWVLERKRMRP